MKVHAVLATPTLLCPAGYPGSHMMHNSSDERIFFAPDGDPNVTALTGIPVEPGTTTYHEPISFGPKGPPAIYVIHAGSGEKSLRYGNTSFIAT